MFFNCEPSDRSKLIDLRAENARLRENLKGSETACEMLYTDKQELIERVKELESAVAAAIHAFDAYEMDVDTYPTIEHVKLKNGLLSHLNKFALEQKIEVLEKYTDMCAAFRTKPSIESLRHHIEQLRKGKKDG